jgi:hypothetical protein
MGSLPPLNFSANANSSSALNTSGSLFRASGDGDWNVNMRGLATQGGGSLLMLAAVGVVLWLLSRR